LQFEPRVPLAFAISHDHCKTWSRPVVVTKQAGYMYKHKLIDRALLFVTLSMGFIPAAIVGEDETEILKITIGELAGTYRMHP